MTRQALDPVSAEKTATAMTNINKFMTQYDPKKMLEFIATNQEKPTQYLFEAVICSIIYLQRDTIRGQLTQFYSQNEKERGD